MCVNGNLLTFVPKVAFKVLLTVCTAVTYLFVLALVLFSDVTYFSLDNGS